jgi:hypothetical protein
MARRPPRAFPDRLFDVVRNFVEYGLYAHDINKAAKILHKHHPDVPLAACEEEFRKHMTAYTDAIAFVEENKEYYGRLRNNSSAGLPPISDNEFHFFRKHPDVPQSTLRTMIYFIFDWRHVR